MAFRLSVKAVGVITATVVVLLLMGMTYSLRDKRFIAEYLNNSNDVLLKIDDVDVSVTVFLDNNRTRFYDAYEWDPENPLRTCRRILIAFQDQEVDYPKLLSVSQRGIGVVGGWARVWQLGGRRYIVQKDCEGVDYDVRGDMKGLDADIEMHSSAGFVEYIIKRRTQGKPRELVLRIKNCLHDYILVLGTGDSLHNESGKGHGMDEMIYASTYAVDKACLASTATVDERHKEVLNDGLQAKDELKSAQLASEKNQVMDALLDQLQIPADYGSTMIALYRDRSQDVVTRDFAVQHIGHYALALNRRGQYDADTAEAKTLRAALLTLPPRRAQLSRSPRFAPSPTWRNSTRASTPAASIPRLPIAPPIPKRNLPRALWRSISAANAASLPLARRSPPSLPTPVPPKERSD